MVEKQAWWAFEAGVVAALVAGGLSQRFALRLLGVSRGSWHARQVPRAAVAVVVPHRQRRAASWLTEPETEQITALLTAAFAAGKSVYQGFYEALDAGTPVASLSSWYRIARAHLERSRPVRRRAARRACAMPQWEATAPMQVWSWDITQLKGPYTTTWYHFYVVIDVFSRLIVAWRVEEAEDDDLARDMFQDAITAHGGQVPRIVHSDGGPSMTSHSVRKLLHNLGIETSKNRPRVSNDNPYSESWFKTAKYTPGYPTHFTSLAHARTWAQHLVTWYNTEHRHSSLEGHTPTHVHNGTWRRVHAARQTTMNALAQANPHRYPHGATVKTPYATVALNNETTKERLRTG